MILAGRQSRVQSRVAPSAPPAHPLAAVLGDLLEATRSLAESVSVLVCYFFFPSIFLPTLCLQIAWFFMLMPCYRQARRRRFGPPWRRRMILLPVTLYGGGEAGLTKNLFKNQPRLSNPPPHPNKVS